MAGLDPAIQLPRRYRHRSAVPILKQVKPSQLELVLVLFHKVLLQLLLVNKQEIHYKVQVLLL